MSSAESRDAADPAAPVALIDLGDTLCDCTAVLRDGLARLRGPTEDARDDALEALPPHLEARRRLVMSVPGFWRDLPPLPLGFELLQLLRDEGFTVHVVTKGPHDVPQAWADKVAWCRRHLPGVQAVVTDDKALVHGHVLVDDWLPYVARWQRRWATGLAIVPAQPWNARATPGPRRVRYDGRNRSEVQAALRTCRQSVDDAAAETPSWPGTGSPRR